MDHRLYVVGTAVLATLGLLAGPLRAQEREVMPAPTEVEAGAEVVVPQPDYLAPQPAPPEESGYMPQPVGPVPARPLAPFSVGAYPPFPQGWVPAPSPPPKEHLLNGPVCKWVRSCSCWSCINCNGCGSLPQEWNYFFGSCRTFYGEPCLKGPPAPLVPLGYGQDPGGYGAPPQPGGCCNH